MFEDHMNEPCFARDKFHAKTKNKSVLCVQKSDKEYYEFKVKKKTYKTNIYGDEYNMFLMNYNMKHGDKIKIHLDKKGMCGFFFLEAFDKYGYPKQRVEEEFNFLESAEALAVTKGLNLTYTQISKINQIVDELGLGLGVFFFHKINGSDIAKNMLHIPKLAAWNLDIPENGNAVIEVTENGKHDYGEA
ncbi:hypothetical protein QYE76_023600 [Lolium multiflorum]|uniref:Uncharacterized protein n=1 Tax=Lolium multiflorum TaxID=4521 RepID=A0AAD8RAK1_LOLMU|nr:hypothetical protein QYE76_023600 [Lolium multiflorum]